MENKICQSCGIPIEKEEVLGTNKDGSVNNDYWKYCYTNEKFIDKVPMEEYIEMCFLNGSRAEMTNEEMKEHCTKLFSTLKRWENSYNLDSEEYNPNFDIIHPSISYWLANRSVYTSWSGRATFDIFGVQPNEVASFWLFGSMSGDERSISFGVRAVVYI